MPLAPISAPIATNAPQAGISSEMKASDSPKASMKHDGSCPRLVSAHEVSEPVRKLLHSKIAFPSCPKVLLDEKDW